MSDTADRRRRLRRPRGVALTRPVVVMLAVAGCLPLAVGAVWLLPWVYWPFVLLLLGLAVWGTSLLTLLMEEDLERRGSHGLVDGFARLGGAIGMAVTDLAPAGMVKVAGEVWSARAVDALSLRQGSAVTVVGAHDSELLVAAVPDDPPPHREQRGEPPGHAPRLDKGGSSV